MANELPDDLRAILAQMRNAEGSDHYDHLADANRLIKAFIRLKDVEARRQVIDLAEHLVPKQA